MRTGLNKGNPVAGLTAATHLMTLSHSSDVRTTGTGRVSHLQSASIKALLTVSEGSEIVVQRENE